MQKTKISALLAELQVGDAALCYFKILTDAFAPVKGLFSISVSWIIISMLQEHWNQLNKLLHIIRGIFFKLFSSHMGGRWS